MAELQIAGVEPDVWKLEGTEDTAVARTGGWEAVGVIILGQGEEVARIRIWLQFDAQTEGVLGFAVGRTIFWAPVLGYKEGRLSREEAVKAVAAAYKGVYDNFEDTRARKG